MEQYYATITDSTTAIPNNKASTFDEPVTNSPDTLISVVTADQGIPMIFIVELLIIIKLSFY